MLQSTPQNLHVVHYPDERLRRRCLPITKFDDNLASLVQHMLNLMRQDQGVGLAAPQVGINTQLFVMNPTGEPDDNHILINPSIHEAHGSIEAEEGCLSLPGIRVNVRRARQCRVSAQDLQGRHFEINAQDLIARICQHETDHLNGVLIIDRMGPSDRIATRKTLKALEDQHKSTRKSTG